MKLLVVYTIALVAGIHAAVTVDKECVGIRNGSTFRVKDDCSKYYTCNGGKFVGSQCPHGLFWDQVHRVCTAPELVSCNVGPFATAPVAPIPPVAPVAPVNPQIPVWTTAPVIITTAVVPIDIENTEIELDEYKCPKNGVSSVAHKDSCSKYVMCFDGVPVVQDCAPGLHFDAHSGQCTYPIYARCGLQDRICPMWNDPYKMIFIADKFDCAKYYYCYNGEPHENSCAQGLHWDPINNWCTPIEKSHCTNFTPYKEVYEPLLTPKTVSCSDTSAHWVDHPKSCRHYYLCYKGKAMLKRCDEGLFWDNEAGSCNYGSITRCGK
ncbi:AAEL002588-PA [Aedes aegypti]|uniref:AAEL002588-PA n=2 Tax=Aedes aegypti TaxID=7159 RepID=A0A1S4F273_AEDAE|nr:protein obstructor-E [Aedes aegypti]EAT46170.1 AAEL002588-PA [Aedes aegypti]